MSRGLLIAPAVSERLRNRLAAEAVSNGYRLGLIVAEGDDAAERHASELLESVGLSSLRRLARLRPRPGEQELRSDDVTDFIERYGHEYVAIHISPTVFVSADEQERFVSAAEREQCDVLWRDMADPDT